MDGHNDVPIQLRGHFSNQINSFDFDDTSETGLSHQQRRQCILTFSVCDAVQVGAQYWSVYVPASITEPEAVQMTLEQIDVTKRLVSVMRLICNWLLLLET